MKSTGWRPKTQQSRWAILSVLFIVLGLCGIWLYRIGGLGLVVTFAVGVVVLQLLWHFVFKDAERD